jgi:hypothetical protein
MIGTEELSPPNHAAVDRRVAAKVAEIACALQVEVTGGNVWHRFGLSLPRYTGRAVDLALSGVG